MKKLVSSVLFGMILIPVLLTGCTGGSAAEVKPDVTVQELELHDVWQVDGQWELHINLVRYIGTGESRIQVFYDYKNLGCEQVTEGYDALRLAPRVYNNADREIEYQPDEIDIRTAAVGKSAKKCSYFVKTSDGTPINQCWIIFSHAEDDGDTCEGVYHITLK